jgi:glucose/arabinose dehydrogenase
MKLINNSKAIGLSLFFLITFVSAGMIDWEHFRYVEHWSTPAVESGGGRGIIKLKKSPSTDHIFAVAKVGTVRVYPSINADEDDFEIVYDNRENIYSWFDRGLLGFDLDPNWPETPYAYVFYSMERHGGLDPWEDQCPDNTTKWFMQDVANTRSYCEGRARFERIGLDLVQAEDGTQRVVRNTDNDYTILEGWCTSAPSHHIGDMQVLSDGSIVVGAGDGGQYTHLDYGLPQDECTYETGLYWQGSYKPLLPQYLNGKLIRIFPEVLHGNEPLTGDDPGHANNVKQLEGIRYEVIARGLRNPFHLKVDSRTGDIWIGDVGGQQYEQIHRIANPLLPREGPIPNYGWPCIEGPADHDVAIIESAQVHEADPTIPDVCVDETADYTPTYIAYSRDVAIDPDYPNQCNAAGACITGVEFYLGDKYPEEYQNKLFWVDCAKACIFYHDNLPDPENEGVTTIDPDPSPEGTHLFAFLSGLLVDVMEIDGLLYVLDLERESIYRIEYFADNQAPTVIATATPDVGIAPLEVTFDVSESFDVNAPEDSIVQFRYDFDNDGVDDIITDGDVTSVSFVFEGSGLFETKITAVDTRGAEETATVPVSIDVGISIQAVIDPPSGEWMKGDVLNIQLIVLDEAGNPIPDEFVSISGSTQHCLLRSCGLGKEPDCHGHNALTGSGKVHEMVPEAHPMPSHLRFDVFAAHPTIPGLTQEKSFTTKAKTFFYSVDANIPSLEAEIVTDERECTLPCYIESMGNIDLQVELPEYVGGESANEIQKLTQWITRYHNATDGTIITEESTSVSYRRLANADSVVHAVYEPVTLIEDAAEVETVPGLSVEGEFVGATIAWTQIQNGDLVVAHVENLDDGVTDSEYHHYSVQSASRNIMHVALPSGIHEYRLTAYVVSMNETSGVYTRSVASEPIEFSTLCCPQTQDYGVCTQCFDEEQLIENWSEQDRNALGHPTVFENTEATLRNIEASHIEIIGTGTDSSVEIVLGEEICYNMDPETSELHPTQLVFEVESPGADNLELSLMLSRTDACNHNGKYDIVSFPLKELRDELAGPNMYSLNLVNLVVDHDKIDLTKVRSIKLTGFFVDLGYSLGAFVVKRNCDHALDNDIVWEGHHRLDHCRWIVDDFSDAYRHADGHNAMKFGGAVQFEEMVSIEVNSATNQLELVPGIGAYYQTNLGHIDQCVDMTGFEGLQIDASVISSPYALQRQFSIELIVTEEDCFTVDTSVEAKVITADYIWRELLETNPQTLIIPLSDFGLTPDQLRRVHAIRLADFEVPQSNFILDSIQFVKDCAWDGTSTALPPGTPVLFLNCGGDDVPSDCDMCPGTFEQHGVQWITDNYFIGGAVGFTGLALGRENLRTWRTFNAEDSDGAHYSIPLEKEEAARYRVIVHMNEGWFSESEMRVFDLYAEEQLISSNIDLFAEHPYRQEDVRREFVIDILDGTLDIRFGFVLNQPIISGVEIYEVNPSEVPLALPPSPPVPPRDPYAVYDINCGMDREITSNGIYWDRDMFYYGGWNYGVVRDGEIGQKIYSKTHRVFPWSGEGYRIPLQNGNYTVEIAFAETRYEEVGERVFSVIMQGEIVISYLDVYAEVGKDVYTQFIDVNVPDGFLEIEFFGHIGDAFVSSIRVLSPTPQPDVLDEFNNLVAYRQNLGGDRHVLYNSKVWNPDTPQFTIHPAAVHETVVNEEGNTLYDSRRVFSRQGEAYTFFVQPGTYSVSLIVHAEDGNLDVYASVEEEGVDLLQIANGEHVRVNRLVTVIDYHVDVGLWWYTDESSTARPGLSAVEIVKVSDDITEKIPFNADSGTFTIDCGGENDASYTPTPSSSDRYETSEDDMLNTNRVFHRDGGYKIFVPNGKYDIVLGMMEGYYERAGERRFDVVVEGRKMKSVKSASKGKLQLVTIKGVRVADGTLDVDFKLTQGFASIGYLAANRTGPLGEEPWVYIIIGVGSAMIVLIAVAIVVIRKMDKRGEDQALNSTAIKYSPASPVDLDGEDDDAVEMKTYD